MKTSVNDLEVYNFKPIRKKSMLPHDSVDENGASKVIFTEVSDEDIPRLPYEQCQLKALLSAGVDPSKSSIDTSTQSRFDAVNALDGVVNSLDESFFNTDNQNV